MNGILQKWKILRFYLNILPKTGSDLQEREHGRGEARSRKTQECENMENSEEKGEKAD